MKYDVNDIVLWNLPRREEIEKDENIVYEGEHGYLYLKDNPEARIFVFYLDTPQDISAAGKDVMELYLYLFRKYDIFFYHRFSVVSHNPNAHTGLKQAYFYYLLYIHPIFHHILDSS